MIIFKLILGEMLDPRLLGEIFSDRRFFIIKTGGRKMVTISKFSYENPRYINLFKRRSSIPEEVETTVKEVLKNVMFPSGFV